MKLKTKIQLYSSLFLLVLLILVNTSIYFLFYKMSSENELDQLVDQTNTMVRTLHSNPEIEQRALLDAFLPANGMIRVFSEDDTAIMSLAKQSGYWEFPGSYATRESREIVTSADGVYIAVISRPIIWNDGEVVTLQVTEELIAFKETMRTLFYVLLIATLLMLIPTIIASRLLSRFLLQPIHALTATMSENATEGKWETIDLRNRPHDELYEMEKTFNEMIDSLKENFQKQETFVSDASHELKTPISIVKSYAQLIKRRGKEHPELMDESIGAIDSEADRMQKLVEQMLLLAKSEVEVVQKKVNFIELCEQTVQKYRNINDRSITLEVEDEEVSVIGNEDQIQQVIYILIDNALKYSQDAVELVITKDDDQALLRVKDYGPGITAEDQQAIFDRFYRVDKARNRKTGGTGLGLAIAKTITETHQGQLLVESEKGKGTTFILQLPLMHEKTLSEF